MVSERVESLIAELLVEYRSNPVDMLGLGDGDGEARYIAGLAESYRRTVADISGLFNAENRKPRILEIGAYLGVVSRALTKLECDVVATEHPCFAKSARLADFFSSHGIPLHGVDLADASLPFPTESFDAVIICEVIEHLNFNPLPALLEISRVVRPGGYAYVAMPNFSSLLNRVRVLRGRSPHNPISDYLVQLDRRRNMEVGLHWREYTARETCEMLEIVGFRPVHVRQEVPSNYFSGNPVKALLKRFIYAIQSLRPMQVVIAEKKALPSYPHWRSPTAKSSAPTA